MVLTAQTIGIGSMAARKPGVVSSVGQPIRLPFGGLEAWKKEIGKKRRSKLLAGKEIVATDFVVLATDKQVARLKNVGFKFKEFDKFEVVHDGHPKSYTLIVYPEGSKYPSGGFAPLTGRPINPNGNQRRHIFSYKLSNELAAKLKALVQDGQIETDVHFEMVFKGIERLKNDKKYEAVEFERIEPGHRAANSAFRVSDAELNLINSVRRPGEANQAVIRRLLKIALEPGGNG